MPKNILITVAGPDQPGITSKLMNILVQTNETICDLGQSVTHGLLSLSFLVKPQNWNNGDTPFIKELLFEASKMNLHLSFQEISDVNQFVHDSEKFVLSCVSTKNLEASFIRDMSSILASHNINILRLDNVNPKNFKALEIITTLPKDIDFSKVKAELLTASTVNKVDIAFLKDNVWRRSKRLIVFDMDSTLIQTEVIDEMADRVGAGESVREITERAMNGELDFNQSLVERVSQLKGLKVEEMQDILENLPFTPGVEDFIKTVKNLGYKVALISGGFSFFANALKEKLDLDYAFANELKIVDGKLTGEVEGTIINAQQKEMILKMITQQEKISLEQVVAIGDGANDLPMLSAAGLGIAFHAKDVVKKEAEQHMSHGPMTTILYFLGIPDPN
tara:strand:- start:102715 stop:103890 length:1176 start_codon:yes stop_codon:yes gene_type:complete